MRGDHPWRGGGGAPERASAWWCPPCTTGPPTPAPELVRPGDVLYASGFTAAGELLDLADPPTALFAASDLEALGAYEAVRRRGLWMGRDVGLQPVIIPSARSRSMAAGSRSAGSP